MWLMENRVFMVRDVSCVVWVGFLGGCGVGGLEVGC